jgi:uncharacterized protein (DUF1330 family)
MHRTYVIAEAIVTNHEKFEKEFMPAVRHAHNIYGGMLLVRTDIAETLRSETPYNRVAIFEFNDKAQVHKWYESPEMRRAFEISKQCVGDFLIRILDGVEIKV